MSINLLGAHVTKWGKADDRRLAPLDRLLAFLHA